MNVALTVYVISLAEGVLIATTPMIVHLEYVILVIILVYLAWLILIARMPTSLFVIPMVKAVLNVWLIATVLMELVMRVSDVFLTVVWM